jgi:ABC-type dipeptide/oligopeptide/nickel transport system permease component
MQGLLPYIIRRLLWAPVILLVVSFIAFTITRFGPGDPLRIAMGQYSNPAALERVRSEEGLDKPLLEQYGIYLKNLSHGELGESYIYRGRDVGEIIFPKIWVSVQLGLVALLIIFLAGIPLGVFAALRQGRWSDPFSIGVVLFFQSIPVVVAVPIMLLVFVLKLHWLPAAGWNGVFDRHIVMPALAIALPGIAVVARYTRATTLSVLREDYVRTARAKGLREFTVISRHVMRNALLPLVTVAGISLATLVEGAFFAETLLGIPGIGRFTVESVGSRDYNVILALVLILTTTFILANIVIDIAYTAIDPRVRYERQRLG